MVGRLVVLDSDAEWVRKINRFARWPDLTVVLELPAEVALARVVAREGTRERYDDLPR